MYLACNGSRVLTGKKRKGTKILQHRPCWNEGHCAYFIFRILRTSWATYIRRWVKVVKHTTQPDSHTYECTYSEWARFRFIACLLSTTVRTCECVIPTNCVKKVTGQEALTRKAPINFCVFKYIDTLLNLINPAGTFIKKNQSVITHWRCLIVISYVCWI